LNGLARPLVGTPPEMSSYTIHLHLIRSETQCSTDDSLKISLNHETGNYTLKYTDKNTETNSNSISESFDDLGHCAVAEHMRVLIKSVALDEQGFSKIQMDVPGMPRMILSVDKLREVYYREHIADMIHSGLHIMMNSKKPVFVEDKVPDAPMKKRRTSMAQSNPECNQPVSRHLYFGVDDDETDYRY